MLSASIAACAPEEQIQKKTSVDIEFQQYVHLFEIEQGVNVDIDIQFQKIELPTVGKCYYAFYTEGPQKGQRVNLNIEIDPVFWEEANDTEREVLIFHELGHCVLNRDHVEDIIEPYELPKSIMYPVIFDSAYSDHRNYYVNELKNPQTLLTDYLE